MKEEIFAICQLCIDIDAFCQNKDYKLTTYRFHDHYSNDDHDRKFEMSDGQQFYNTCDHYKPDWVLLIKHGIKEWIPK